MKRERSVRRMEEETKLIRNKQIEIKSLENDIEQVQKEKMHFDEILRPYQPHWNLLAQVIGMQSERFPWASLDRWSIKPIDFNRLTN